MITAEFVSSELIKRIEKEEGPTLHVLELPRGVFARNVVGRDGQFGWMSPRVLEDESGIRWVVPVCTELIAEQVDGLVDEVVTIYLAGISFFAYTHLAQIVRDVDDFDARQRQAEDDMCDELAPELLRVMSLVEMRAVERTG